ncbi:MAG: Regulation of enolase protein [Cypionkella sp.]|nr:Regulation of enolase protein [Cypionkella sp.]
MKTDKGSDFWLNTYYGFTRDSGHFFGARREGDFTASLCIKGDYTDLYDQAGLMVRVDETAWVKAGIELSDGEACLGSVLTVGQSDWATSVHHGPASILHLRITVEKGVLRIQWSQDGMRWPLLRLCRFPKASTYLVGPVACSPEREGLKVQFSEFQLGAPNGKALHDLT